MERISYRCNCGAALNAPGNANGRQATCHQCGQQLLVPLLAEVLESNDRVVGHTAAARLSKNRGSDCEVICNVCHSPIASGEAVEMCSQCNLQYHVECWRENLGCATYSCANVNVLKQGPDIRISDVSLRTDFASAGARAPVHSKNAQVPWDFVMLAAAALAMLCSLCSFGFFSIGSTIACVLYCGLSRQGRPSSAMLAAILLSVVGVVTGFIASIVLWC